MTNKVFHIKSLDGIRAIAVMLVFISHAGFSKIIPGGFGVTIFFFLSGFLITTLLRNEYEKKSDISLKNFYLRRVYRIFPSLYMVLLVVIALSYLGVISHNMQSEAVAFQFLHLTNYYAIFVTNANFVPGTSVLWSLAVEEHFYLIFPIFFVIMIKSMSYRNIAITLAVFCVMILLWRCYLVFELSTLQPHTYKSTDTRIDSIMFGCIMGVFMNPVYDKDIIKSEFAKVVILVVSLCVLLFCFLYRDAEFRESFRYTLQGLALFPVFYLAVHRSEWLLFRWLNWQPIRYLGTISYTFYLFHFVSIILVRDLISDSTVALVFFGFIITFLFSSFMYFFVEKRFLLLRKKLHSEM